MGVGKGLCRERVEDKELNFGVAIAVNKHNN
jgi:hypothetical protein